MRLTVVENGFALAVVGAAIGAVLPHPLQSKRGSKVAEAAGCSVIFGLAFAAGSGGFNDGLDMLAIAAGALGLPIYLALVPVVFSIWARLRSRGRRGGIHTAPEENQRTPSGGPGRLGGGSVAPPSPSSRAN